MASKGSASIATIFLSVNILLFSLLTFIPSSAADCQPDDFLKLRACADALRLLSLNIEARRTVPGNCPPDALKLKLCADVLGAIVLKLPAPQHECRSPIGNLVGLNAVACLSTSLHVNVLNLIKLDVPIDLSLLLNHCDVSSTNEFKCA
ncbi:hypothetical protein WN943_013780 [Citrus x changshan-huyou]